MNHEPPDLPQLSLVILSHVFRFNRHFAFYAIAKEIIRMHPDFNAFRTMKYSCKIWISVSQIVESQDLKLQPDRHVSNY